mgnify:CR=1 FL=1
MIRKKITSILASTMVFCFMVCASVTGVKADNSKVEMVDGSYLISADHPLPSAPPLPGGGTRPRGTLRRSAACGGN